MFDVTQGPARKALLVRNPDTLAESLDHEDLIALDRGPLTPSPGSGTIVIDANRRRPLYFDGRFLAARDLTREQEYFLTRQADLNRAGGMGVVAGLGVKPGQTATAIRIEPGHGATPSGALVLISDEIEIDLADVTATQRLDAAFGLSKIPSMPARSRSGLFIVALRPVEFTAGRIAAYPTSIMGQRSTEYGDIVEATAVTLIPYEDQGGRMELDQRRARAAREIFLLNGDRGVPADALPLAIIALDRGVQRWIDPYLVRREVGAQHGDMLRLTTVSRAQREAYLLQYDQHLQDVLNQRRASNATWRFPASAHFQALPPAGRLPAAAVDGSDFTQVFFPAQIEAELSFVAEDEIRPMLDEAMLLPPIDLTLSGDALESTVSAGDDPGAAPAAAHPPGHVDHHQPDAACGRAQRHHPQPSAGRAAAAPAAPHPHRAPAEPGRAGRASLARGAGGHRSALVHAPPQLKLPGRPDRPAGGSARE